ncbi:beta strand repeat-containing protein [Leptolyngbyaceae cyanobacterium UHCC 1019]
MPVNFTGSYTQSFNSLANSGTNRPWTNDNTILGWSLFRQPTSGTAITTYSAGNGTSTTGSFISYGSTGSTDRALGGLGSGSSYFGSPANGAVAGWIAFAATNTTGATLNTVNLAFNGEQWRNGGNTTAQTMVLQYGFGASFAAVSTWNTPGGNFNWASPVATATAAAVNGNVAGRVANRGGMLNGLNWANGNTLWVRWVENNDNGNDHGLAIDDFSLSLPPTVNLSVSTTAGTEAGTTVVTVTATASSAVVGAQTLSLGVSGTGITAGDYSLSSPTITILNGQTTGTATFTVVDDAIVEGTEAATLTISNPSGGIVLGSTTTQAIAIADNDTAGVTITQSAGNTAIAEGGITDTYTVALTSQPTDNVTINLNPGTQTSTNINTLTFTAANWNTAQTITVTAVDDNVTEGNHSGTITHTTTSMDANYNGITVGSVIAAIADNDNPPTDLLLSATTTNENVAPNTLIGTFTTLDPDGGSFTYTFVSGSGSTDNSAFTLTGEQLRLNASPDFETQSSYSIRVRTTDFSGLTYDKAFSIIVNNLNDAPILNDTVVTLNSVRSNAPAPLGAVGTRITQLANLIGGSGQNNVIDPDASALTGIAIIATDSSNGTWFYSLNNGTNWTILDGVSNTNALLLADDANTRLYFRPNTGYTGTLANAITYRAWDQTSGINGTTADTTTNGNATAFSVQFDSASLQVDRTATTDFTQDGITDILWRNGLNGQNLVWEMDGTTYKNATFINSVAVNSGWNAVGTGDFTKDGKTDILWRNSGSGQNLVWEMDGTTYKNATFINSVAAGSGWEVVGTGDFTKDGKTDILWRNSGSGQNLVWEMDGTTYKNATFINSVAAGSGWEVVGTGDFTKDGKTDILWRNSGSGQNLVWEMDGTTYKNATFIESVPNSSGWKVAGVGDFTKDGNADVLWHNSLDGSVGIWGMNGTTYNGYINIGSVSPSSGWNIV